MVCPVPIRRTGSRPPRITNTAIERRNILALLYQRGSSRYTIGNPFSAPAMAIPIPDVFACLLCRSHQHITTINNESCPHFMLLRTGMDVVHSAKAHKREIGTVYVDWSCIKAIRMSHSKTSSCMPVHILLIHCSGNNKSGSMPIASVGG